MVMAHIVTMTKREAERIVDQIRKTVLRATA